MTLDEFRSLVASNTNWFEGIHHETAESLAAAETALGVQLPPTLKWLLSERGYSASCGIGSIRESIKDTIRCRNAIGLPHRYVILDDLGDAGVVLLDTSSPDGRVIWVGEHTVYGLKASEPASDIDVYPDYPSWVMDCLQIAKDDEA